MAKHDERKHSKFSASGAERWFNCPGSVELSEGVPRRDSKWSLEGTKAHEVLEGIARAAIESGSTKIGHAKFPKAIPREMVQHGVDAVNFMLKKYARAQGDAEFLVETRIHLPFIHPDMFGTFDGAVVEVFGTLDVFDYKYGSGHSVSPKKNLQMITYGMGLAARYHWNFKRVRLWIVQPRIRGYNGPLFWELPILELKKYVAVFKKAVKRVEQQGDVYKEGSWCHWCVTKGKCPLKTEGRDKKAMALFKSLPLTTRKGK